MNDLTIERMYELEQMAFSSNIIFPLNLNEWRYLERADKIPLNDVKNLIHYFRRNFLFLDEFKFLKEIMNQYNCKENEVKQRFKDVQKIIRYENLIIGNLLKEQKKMVKRMNI